MPDSASRTSGIRFPTGTGHFSVAEHAGPFAGCGIGGDDDGGAFVEPADEVEEKLAIGWPIESNFPRTDGPYGACCASLISLLVLYAALTPHKTAIFGELYSFLKRRFGFLFQACASRLSSAIWRAEGHSVSA